jgi:hypothetical protein
VRRYAEGHTYTNIGRIFLDTYNEHFLAYEKAHQEVRRCGSGQTNPPHRNYLLQIFVGKEFLRTPVVAAYNEVYKPLRFTQALMAAPG